MKTPPRSRASRRAPGRFPELVLRELGAARVKLVGDAAVPDEEVGARDAELEGRATASPRNDARPGAVGVDGAQVAVEPPEQRVGRGPPLDEHEEAREQVGKLEALRRARRAPAAMAIPLFRDAVDERPLGLRQKSSE